jgi:ABC-type oligopeptide transport system ATPase subunit
MNRPNKTTPEPLSKLLQKWEETATEVLGGKPEELLPSIKVESIGIYRGAEVTDEQINNIANQAIHSLHQKRCVWRESNITSVVMDSMAATNVRVHHDDLETVVKRATSVVMDRSIALNEGAPITISDDVEQKIGTFHGKAELLYSSPAILAAERDLLASSKTTNAPTVSAKTIQANSAGLEKLSPNQRASARAVVQSRASLVTLVGPAGSGKTTTTRGIRELWEAEHGPDSVRAFARQATSGDVLAAELGVKADTLDKLFHETIGQGGQWRKATIADLEQQQASSDKGFSSRSSDFLNSLYREQDQWAFKANDLVMVDESSQASTFQMAALNKQVQAAGGKLLFVGDPIQLGTPEGAGGSFGMLTRTARGPQLTEVFRFQNEWEGDATLALRNGDHNVIEVYHQHGRIHGGAHDEMLDKAYNDWVMDTLDGHSSILIAGTNDDVTALNNRAQRDRVANGEVDLSKPLERGGVTIGVGETILARTNDRKNKDSQGNYVKNGHLLTVDSIDHTNRRLHVTDKETGATRTLDDEYKGQIQLGYASTISRVQGVTVDRCRALLSKADSFHSWYVAMTRGKDNNHAYVDTSTGDHIEAHHREAHNNDPDVEALNIMSDVMKHHDPEFSATEQQTHINSDARSLPTLVNQADTMQRRLEQLHWETVIGEKYSPQMHAATTANNDDLMKLSTALRTAHSRGLPPHLALDRAIAMTEKAQENETPKPSGAQSETMNQTPSAPLNAREYTDRESADKAPIIDQVVSNIRLLTKHYATRATPDPNVELVTSSGLGAHEHNAYRALINDTLNERMTTFDTDPPEWASAIGERPTDPESSQKWENAAKTGLLAEARGLKHPGVTAVETLNRDRNQTGPTQQSPAQHEQERNTNEHEY